MRISLMMKPHDGDAWIKRVLDVPTKPRTRRPPLSEKDRKWSHVGKFSLAAVIKHRELRKLTPQQLEERKRLIEEKRNFLQFTRDYSFLFTEEENIERAKIKTQTQRTKCYFRWDNTSRKLGSSLAQKGSQDLKYNGDRCDKVQDFKANTQKGSQQSVHHVNRSRFHNHNGHSGKVQNLKRNSNYKPYTPKDSPEPVHHVNQTHNHYGIHPVKQNHNNYGDNKKVQDWDRNYKVDTQRVAKERGYHRIHRMSHGTSFDHRQDLGYTAGMANVAGIDRKGTRKFRIGTVITRLTHRVAKERGYHRIHRMSHGTSFDHRQDLGYTAGMANVAGIDRKGTRNCWESENAQRKRKREVEESLHMPRLSHCC